MQQAFSNRPRVNTVISARAGKVHLAVHNNQQEAQMATDYDTGFPPLHMVAQAERRYVNKYYWEAATNKWFLIVDCKSEGTANIWVMREVDARDGAPFGNVKRSTVDLWVDRFADRPFNVSAPEDSYRWFRTLALQAALRNRQQVGNVDALYEAYLDRRKHMSSYDALVRVGLRRPV